MKKGFKIVFYTLFGILFFGVLYLTTVMYMSPRRDAEERGFIKCTKKLVLDLQMCKAGSLGCPFKLLIKDMGCNIGVVGTGFAGWLKGEQSTPWANYLFEPKIASVDDEGGDKIVEPLSDAEFQNEFVRRKLQELEQAKHRELNILPSELLQSPEQKPYADLAVSVEEENNEVEQESIDDEANISGGVAAAKTSESAEPTSEATNLLQKLKKQTEEKLQKGNLKDEK